MLAPYHPLFLHPFFLFSLKTLSLLFIPATFLHLCDSRQLGNEIFYESKALLFHKIMEAQTGWKNKIYAHALPALSNSYITRYQKQLLLTSNESGPIHRSQLRQYLHPTPHKPTKIHSINITEKWPREPHQRRQRRKYLAKLIEPDDREKGNNLGRSNGSKTSQRCRQPLDVGSASAKSAWRSKYLIVAQSPYATTAMSTIQI